jgi:hypothetical protein
MLGKWFIFRIMTTTIHNVFGLRPKVSINYFYHERTAGMTVQVKEIYSKVYEALKEDIDDVLREHAIEQLEQRIVETSQNIQLWEEKYGCDYETFLYRTATNEAYVRQLNVNVETQMWEGDLISWEFEMRELEAWQSHLHQLLTIS